MTIRKPLVAAIAAALACACAACATDEDLETLAAAKRPAPPDAGWGTACTPTSCPDETYCDQGNACRPGCLTAADCAPGGECGDYRAGVGACFYAQ